MYLRAEGLEGRRLVTDVTDRDFLYAPKNPRCLVCSLPSDQWAEVNAALWDAQERRPDYRVAGVRACAMFGLEVKDPKSITNHVEHMERSWHRPTQYPPTARERQVFPTDYVSVTDRAAKLGVDAMEALSTRLEGLEARDLIAVAKLGMGARQHQAALEAKDRRSHQVEVTAIFGFVSGHMGIPEVEAKDVTPTAELRAAMEEERRLLEERAAG